MLNFVCFLLLMFSLTIRKEEVRLIAPELHGIIQEKYRSNNHGQGSIILQGDKQVRFEGVNWLVWETLQVGDKIDKHAYNPYALVNDRNEVLLIARGCWAGLQGWNLPSRAVDKFGAKSSELANPSSPHRPPH